MYTAVSNSLFRFGEFYRQAKQFGFALVHMETPQQLLLSRGAQHIGKVGPNAKKIRKINYVNTVPLGLNK